MLQDTSILFVAPTACSDHSEAFELTQTILRSPKFGPSEDKFPEKMSNMIRSSKRAYPYVEGRPLIRFTVDPTLPDPSDALLFRPSRGVEAERLALESSIQYGSLSSTSSMRFTVDPSLPDPSDEILTRLSRGLDAECLALESSTSKQDFTTSTIRQRAYSDGEIKAQDTSDTPVTIRSAPAINSVRSELPKHSNSRTSSLMNGAPRRNITAWIDLSSISLPRLDLALVHIMYDSSPGNVGGRVFQSILCETPSAKLMARNINGYEMRRLLRQQAKVRAPVPLPQEITGICMRAGISRGEPNLEKARQCIRKREMKEEPEQVKNAEKQPKDKPVSRHRTRAQKNRSLKRQAIHQAWREDQLGVFEAAKDFCEVDKLKPRAARKTYAVWMNEFGNWPEHSHAEPTLSGLGQLFDAGYSDTTNGDDQVRFLETKEAGDDEEAAGIRTPSTWDLNADDNDTVEFLGPAQQDTLTDNKSNITGENQPDNSSVSFQHTQDNDEQPNKAGVPNKDHKDVVESGDNQDSQIYEQSSEEVSSEQVDNRGQYRLSHQFLGQYASEDLNISSVAINAAGPSDLQPPTNRKLHVKPAEFDFQFESPIELPTPELPVAPSTPSARSSSSLCVNISRSPSPEEQLELPAVSEVTEQGSKCSDVSAFQSERPDAQIIQVHRQGEVSLLSKATAISLSPGTVLKIISPVLRSIETAAFHRLTWGIWEPSVVLYRTSPFEEIKHLFQKLRAIQVAVETRGFPIGQREPVVKLTMSSVLELALQPLQPLQSSSSVDSARCHSQKPTPRIVFKAPRKSNLDAKHQKAVSEGSEAFQASNLKLKMSPDSLKRADTIKDLWSKFEENHIIESPSKNARDTLTRTASAGSSRSVDSLSDVSLGSSVKRVFSRDHSPLRQVTDAVRPRPSPLSRDIVQTGLSFSSIHAIEIEPAEKVHEPRVVNISKPSLTGAIIDTPPLTPTTGGTVPKDNLCLSSITTLAETLPTTPSACPIGSNILTMSPIQTIYEQEPIQAEHASTQSDDNDQTSVVKYANVGTQTEKNSESTPMTLQNLWDKSTSCLQSAKNLGAEVTRQTIILTAAPFVVTAIGGVVFYALVRHK